MIKIKKGWIKHHRADLEHLKELSDPEYRYYQVSLLLAVWDKKNGQFGTFDARTKSIREHLNWAGGKINGVKNSLIEKGYYSKAENWRLMITNAGLIFGKSHKAETFVKNSEKNFHNHELDVQFSEMAYKIFTDTKKDRPSTDYTPWRSFSP